MLSYLFPDHWDFHVSVLDKLNLGEHYHIAEMCWRLVTQVGDASEKELMRDRGREAKVEGNRKVKRNLKSFLKSTFVKFLC